MLEYEIENILSIWRQSLLIIPQKVFKMDSFNETLLCRRRWKTSSRHNNLSTNICV